VLGIFHLTTMSRLVLVPGGSYPRGNGNLGVKLPTHPHLVPRSKMRGAISLLHQYFFMA